MDEIRGNSRGSPRTSNTSGIQAQQAAMYSFQAAQQLDLAFGHQRANRPMQRAKLSALTGKSTSFTLTGGHFPSADTPLGLPGSPRGTLNSSSPVVSPGPAPTSPRQGTSSSIGGSVATPRLFQPNVIEPSRRSFELDLGPDSGPGFAAELNYYRNGRIFHPWDLAGGVSWGGTASEHPSRAVAAASPGGMVVTAGMATAHAACHEAANPTTAAVSVRSDARPISQTSPSCGLGSNDDVTQQQQQQGPQEVSTPMQLKTMLMGFKRPMNDAAPTAATCQASSTTTTTTTNNDNAGNNNSSNNNNCYEKVNNADGDDNNCMLHEQQSEASRTATPGGIGSEGTISSIRPLEHVPVLLAVRRSFDYEQVQQPSSDGSARPGSRMAPPPPRTPAAVWVEQPSVAQDEGASSPQQQMTQVMQQAAAGAGPRTTGIPDPGMSYTIDSPAAAAAAAAVAFGGRPSATGRIPQPSSLHSSVLTMAQLSKLPPSRATVIRRGCTRASGSSSNGSFQTSLTQLHLAPYTHSAAATGPATVALGTGPSETDTYQAAPSSSSSSAPASPVRNYVPTSMSATTLPSSFGAGASHGNSTSCRSMMEGALAKAGSSNSLPACSPQAALLLDAQRAGLHINIEQILLGSAAATPYRGMANSSPPRADSHVQQAFRNVSAGKASRTATREDVWELQAALLRQLSLLINPPPARVQSPLRGVASSTAVVGAGLRHPVARNIGQGALLHPSASIVGRTPLASESSRKSSTSPDIPRRVTGDGAARTIMAEVSAVSMAPTSTGPPAHSGSMASQASVITAGPPAGVVPFSAEDVAFQPLLTRDADGYVLENLVTGQESALTTALNGLVVQVGVSCIERAHLLHGVWATLRQLLAAVLQDRETAKSRAAAACREASACTTNAAQEVESLQKQVAALTQGMEKMVTKEQDQAAQLAATNKELKRLRRIMATNDLETLGTRLLEAQEGRDTAREEVTRLQALVKDLEAELYDVRQDRAMAAARAAAFESQATALATEVRSRTPRPSRSLGMLDELLSDFSNEKEAVLAALAAGAAPLELHRLMLGVTNDVEDLNPWTGAFGILRSVVPPWSDPATHSTATAPPQDAAVAEATTAALAATACSSAAASSGGGATAHNPGASGQGGGSPAFSRSSRATVLGSGIDTGQAPPLQLPAVGQGGVLIRRGVSFSQRAAAAAAAAAAEAATATTAAAAAGALSPSGGTPSNTSHGMHVDAAQLQPAVDLLAGSSLVDVASLSGGGTTTQESNSISPIRTHTPSTGDGAGHGGMHIRRHVMSSHQKQAYMRKLHAWLVSVIDEGDVVSLRRLFPDEAVDAIGSGLQLDVSTGRMASWMLGSLSPAGFNFVPYKELVGLLSRNFQHTPLDLGGPITSALELAALSTVQRIKALEDQTQNLHREVVRLKRCLADNKRAERARAQAEVDAKERKSNARGRTLHQVHAFIAAKWADFFQGLGSGPKLPKVLHAEGRVFNRRMEKVDAEKLVNAIWAAKADWQSRNPGSRLTLTDFMLTYMQRKYVNSRTVTETAYNLVYTLGQHQYDPDCHLFLRVLLGEVDEGIRLEEEELQADLVNMFSCLDRATHGRCTGYLSKRDMRTTLKAFFPSKTRARFQEVMEALDADCPSSEAVMYRRLFDADRDLNQGVFAETIRNQHLDERLEGLQAIEDALLEAADKARVRHVPPSLLSSVLKSAVSDCNEETVRQYLRIVYGSEAGIRAAEAAAPSANAAYIRATEKAAAGKSHGGVHRPRSAAASRAGGAAASASVMTATAGTWGDGAVGSAAPGTSGGSDSGISDETVVVPTVEAVMALIRRGWMPEIPVTSPVLEHSEGSSKGLSTPRRVGWGAATGLSKGQSAGGSSAVDVPQLINLSGSQRAAIKRLRYLRAMGAARETWLQEEKARVRHVVQLAHSGKHLPLTPISSADVDAVSGALEGQRGSSSSVGSASSGGQTATTELHMAAAAAALGVKISSLASLPSASDFADQEEPEMAALEAAQKILSTQLVTATAAMAASSVGSDPAVAAPLSAELPANRLARGVVTAAAAAGSSSAAAASSTATAGGTSGIVPSAVTDAAAAAAAAALEEASERLQRLRALGGIMAALAEDRPEAPATGLDPDIRRSMYEGSEEVAGSLAAQVMETLVGSEEQH